MKVNTCPSPPRPICPARPGSDPPLHENVRILENGAVFRASEIVAIVGRHVGVATGADQLSGSLGRLISRIDTGAGAASVPAATHVSFDGSRPVCAPILFKLNGDATADITASRDIVEVWKQGIPVDRESWRKRNHSATPDGPSQ